MMGSYSLSLVWIGGKGSEKSQRGSARLMNVFFILETPFPKTNLINSIPTVPTTIAVVVAKAGIIFPAINFTLKLSTSFI